MFHFRPTWPNRPSVAVFRGFWAGFVGRFFPVVKYPAHIFGPRSRRFLGAWAYWADWAAFVR